MEEINKQLENERASSLNILKKLEFSGHEITNLNKELDNERENEKQWEEKVEEIKKQSENKLSQMVQEVQKANKIIKTLENNFSKSIEKLKNSINLIKEKMWGKLWQIPKGFVIGLNCIKVFKLFVEVSKRILRRTKTF